MSEVYGEAGGFRGEKGRGGEGGRQKGKMGGAGGRPLRAQIGSHVSAHLGGAGFQLSDVGAWGRGSRGAAGAGAWESGELG